MAELEHEHEDEAAGAPVSDEPGEDEAEAEAEAEAAETAAQEASQAPQPKSEKEIEKALKAVEQAGTRYRSAVDRAMGEDALDLVPCPRCNAPVAGMIFPPTMAAVDDETRDAVLVSLGSGEAAQPWLNEAKGVEMCPSCDGWGQLRYPTRSAHTETQQCPKCMGSGYVNAETQQQGAAVYTFTPTPDANATTTSGEYSLPDSWGRPIGHPHYGTPPAQVGT